MEQRHQERFDTYESLFEHPGWELFIEEVVKPELESLPERVFRNARNWDEVLAGRAAFSKLEEIASMETFIRQQREDATHEDNLEGGPYDE